jgi:hypothetical protein
VPFLDMAGGEANNMEQGLLFGTLRSSGKIIDRLTMSEYSANSKE